MLAGINPTKSSQNTSFASKENYLFDGMEKSLRPLNTFVKSQENLSHTRFFQDVTTNWVPKVVFVRSLADFTEMTFLEFTESALFYFAPPVLGALFKNAFSNLAPKPIRKEVSENISRVSSEILKEAKSPSNIIAKRAVAIKAAILLACVSIPAAEYALSFAKNLLTLKLFKQSNFNNIANLNKDTKNTESAEQQQKVKDSANKHIKNSGKLALSALAGSIVLATLGHKSEALQKISKIILQPGGTINNGLNKLGIKSQRIENVLKTYINFDFEVKDAKLGLSKGQLVVSTLAGLWGYSEAGKDRGKLDQLEVLTRVPIVVFYTIFGSEIFDYTFKHILHNKNKFPDLVKKAEDGKIKIPTRAELPDLAEKIAKIKNTSAQVEFNRLLKEKSVITAVPYGFALVFMGFLLAGITRFWTQYRYDQSKQTPQEQDKFKNLIQPKKFI